MTVTVKNKNNEIEADFEIVEYDDLPIRGLSDCIKMKYNMLQINEVKYGVQDTQMFVKNNIDVFTGLGA